MLPGSSATKSASCCAKRSAAAASIARSHERACGSCDCAQDDEALGPRETLNKYGTHSSRASSLPQNQAIVGASLLATIRVQTILSDVIAACDLLDDLEFSSSLHLLETVILAEQPG